MVLCVGKTFQQMFPFFYICVFYSKIHIVLQLFTCLNSPNRANITVVNGYDYRYQEPLSTKETVQIGCHFAGYFPKRETLGKKLSFKKRLCIFGGEKVRGKAF